MSDPVLAQDIILDLLAQRIYIDNETFPWIIQKDTAEVLTSGDGMPGIRVTILANQSVAVMDIEEVERINEEKSNA